MIQDIAIYGAGGFGREVACLVHLINEQHPTWNLIGFFDDGKEPGFQTEYGSVLGNIETVNAWEKPLNMVIAIGTPHYLKIIAEKITNPLVKFPNIIAPNTFFLDKNNYQIGKGNIICSGCLISCNVSIGDFNILNGYIPVGHDSSIGCYNVIMPSCNISGGVQMGNENFMGVKSTILQYVKVGNHVRIGTGSVVMKNTKDGYLYIGVPAQKEEI